MFRVMVVEIKVDYSNCIMCKKCVESCVFGVLELLDDQSIVSNPNSCSGCLKCQSNCPVDAIIVKEK